MGKRYYMKQLLLLPGAHPPWYSGETRIKVFLQVLRHLL